MHWLTPPNIGVTGLHDTAAILCCNVGESDCILKARGLSSCVSYKKLGLLSENVVLYRKYMCLIDSGKKQKCRIKWFKKALLHSEWGRLFLFITSRCTIIIIKCVLVNFFKELFSILNLRLRQVLLLADEFWGSGVICVYILLCVICMVILDNLLGVVNGFNAGSGKVLWQQNV